MDQALIEYAVLAFVAGFVLFRLYTTLGRRVDTERPDPRPAPAQGEMPRDQDGPAPMSAPMAGQEDEFRLPEPPEQQFIGRRAERRIDGTP
ncbi:MAG TPA: hypothetical protein PKY87_08445 [Terricaulis sp.]|nr:hypothetical protein [Terricaulis sp.]